MKLPSLIICAGLSALAHAALLGMELSHPPPPARPPLSTRVEIGLVSPIRQPEFSHAQAPAATAAPAGTLERPVPPPSEAPCPPRVAEPVAVTFPGETCRPVPRPPAPEPPLLPDPGRDAAMAARNRAVATAEQPLRAAAPLYAVNPPPDYPDDARRNGWSGEVLVRVAVATDGGVTATKLQVSSGYPVLDAAALTAVRGWRFVPARQGSRAVPGEALVPVRFRLTGPPR